MSKWIRSRNVRKFYHLFVKGTGLQKECLKGYLKKDAKTNRVSVCRDDISGDYIETRYEPLAEYGDKTLVEVELITGRTHQIRAHLAHLGYPICGDDRYGDREKNKRWKVTRQQLWSTRIEFTFKHGTPLAYLDGRKFSVSPEFTLNA